jgi:hypothetical protein
MSSFLKKKSSPLLENFSNSFIFLTKIAFVLNFFKNSTFHV